MDLMLNNRIIVLGMLLMGCSDAPKSGASYRTIGSAGTSSRIDSTHFEQAGEGGDAGSEQQFPPAQGGSDEPAETGSTPTNSGDWTPPPACGGAAPSSGWGPSGCVAANGLAGGGSGGTTSVVAVSMGGSPIVSAGGRASVAAAGSGAPQGGGSGGGYPTTYAPEDPNDTDPYCCGFVYIECRGDDRTKMNYGIQYKNGPLAGQMVVDHVPCTSPVTTYAKLTDRRYLYTIIPYQAQTLRPELKQDVDFFVNDERNVTIMFPFGYPAP